MFCLAIYSGFSKNRVYPRVTETCTDSGLPLVLTLMPRTTAAFGAGRIRAKLYSEMTFCFNPGILSSCDFVSVVMKPQYRGADKSLARSGRKQARKHVRDARDFNKIEMRAVIKFLFLQGKAPNEIHAILTETLDCFLPGRAKDLSASLYIASV